MKKANLTLLLINIITAILWMEGYKTAEWFYALLQKTDLITFCFMFLVFLYQFVKGMFSETESRPSRPLTDEEKKKRNEHYQWAEDQRRYYERKGEERRYF
jgi:hypothetical protein